MLDWTACSPDLCAPYGYASENMYNGTVAKIQFSKVDELVSLVPKQLLNAVKDDVISKLRVSIINYEVHKVKHHTLCFVLSSAQVKQYLPITAFLFSFHILSQLFWS